jgi:hypothetical protein
MANQEKVIFLKNKKNGIIYPVPESLMQIYESPLVEKATPEEVKLYQEGKYWNQKDAKPSKETK